MRQAEEPIVIGSEGDVLHLVILGDDTIQETTHITALNAAVEAMIFTGDIPSVQMKDHYEAMMQNFIEWLVKHRLPQIAAAMRKP